MTPRDKSWCVLMIAGMALAFTLPIWWLAVIQLLACGFVLGLKLR